LATEKFRAFKVKIGAKVTHFFREKKGAFETWSVKREE
jgi:hypothetical protein